MIDIGLNSSLGGGYRIDILELLGSWIKIIIFGFEIMVADKMRGEQLDDRDQFPWRTINCNLL